MKTLRLLIFFTALLFFYSCENFDWFKTDKGLKKNIQGTWKREFLGDRSIDYEEDWHFIDDKVIITRQKNSTTDTIEKNGSFSTDGKLTVSYLKISGFTNSIHDTILVQYNGKWTITQLDSKVLYLVTTSIAGGLLQREFEKK